MKKTNLFLLVTLNFLYSHSGAVQLGQDGLGEVLIYPYYTVNNDLNTLYSVVNTTAEPKAIKIRFLEGDIGIEVLEFNVYLSAFDVWTGVLAPWFSTFSEHAREPSVNHLTNDTSCAPYLNKTGQEFLPFQLDLDIDPENLSMQRATEGHIEVIEMGVLVGEAAVAVDHGADGMPQNCETIERDWVDGVFDSELEEPDGGLMGSASLVNVAEGFTFSYDAIALENFWGGQTGVHTEPGALLPDLNSGSNESRVLLANGDLAISQWSSGYEAVSAVLMRAEIYNEYAFDAVVDGKSEWVMSFPTKFYHTNNGEDVVAPFNEAWDGLQSCDEFEMVIWDRAELSTYLPPDCGPLTGTICQPFQNRTVRFCHSSNVMEFLGISGEDGFNPSKILGSNNKFYHFQLDTELSRGTVLSGSENGWASVEFFGEGQLQNPQSGPGFKGLPVTGFMVQQFTNAGAQEGLLAQYGGLFMHKGLVVTDDEVML